LIRVAAFRAAVPLPRLSGKAPLGGQILSHDFVEAAFIRRAGWDVRLDAELPGSAEDAPQTLEAFHRRDRRWCQGNLQHLRLLAVPGLHTGSRFHLASGAFSYLAAPIWLALVTMAATGALAVNSPLPFLLVALLLLLPKVCALWASLVPSRSWARRGILLRAAGGELLASALLAPLVMVRQTGAVLSVLAGQDCGWKSGRDNSPGLRDGWYEALVGAGLSTIALAVGTSSALWLAPMLLPLLFAPLLVNYFDGVA